MSQPLSSQFLRPVHDRLGACRKAGRGILSEPGRKDEKEIGEESRKKRKKPALSEVEWDEKRERPAGPVLPLSFFIRVFSLLSAMVFGLRPKAALRPPASSAA